jgi:hypothetical protein
MHLWPWTASPEQKAWVMNSSCSFEPVHCPRNALCAEGAEKLGVP